MYDVIFGRAGKVRAIQPVLSGSRAKAVCYQEGFCTGSVKERLLGYTFASPAEYAIVPLQDILGLGREGHMNTPGTVGSPNWEWHLPDFGRAEKEMKHLRHLFRRS